METNININIINKNNKTKKYNVCCILNEIHRSSEFVWKNL
jgi:hypothetical protein